MIENPDCADPESLRLSSRACQPARRRIWCSPHNAVAARCWSSRCAPPASPANRRSSSSTCRPPASRRSPGSGSTASTTSRSCACWIRSTRASPTSRPPEIWRDYIRTVGRTPNGVWGGKLMWNQTPLLLDRVEGLPERSGDGLLAAIRDVVGSRPCPDPRPPPRRGVPGGVLLARRPDPRLARQAGPGTRRPRRVPRRRHRPRRENAARPGGGLAQLVRRGERRADRCGLSGAVAQPDRRSSAPCSRRSDWIRG